MNTENNLKERPVIFYITEIGQKLAGRIEGILPGAEVLKFNTGVFADKWTRAWKIVCMRDYQ
ncbi:MAG TPA: hypothetical protein ENH18_00805 [Nitrospirae bacterium]|nr:hypothetical protein BMS3Bbin09_00869 [bacterium BMS3Bbin09]HDN95340.1 hypothetical protein [Nitrospirota bacterium]HDO66713.1 hypothetical protein [Nitrospirota bacterium]HEW80887.1 hypothetical protein [Nitrospirota bacterium]